MMFKRRKRSMPQLNTASLPDLIFTILFFFILVTHLRSVDVKLHYEIPEGQQLTKIQNRNSIIHVYVDRQGTVQVENDIVAIPQIAPAVEKIRRSMGETERNQLIISFKADRKVKMGIITQVKTELRKVGSLKVNYSATETGNPSAGYSNQDRINDNKLK